MEWVPLNHAQGIRRLWMKDKKLYRTPADEREALFDRITREIARQPDVSFAFLFGSSLTEPAFHDIDVAVYLSHSAVGPTARALEIAEQLTQALEIPVDIRPLNEAPLPFVFHALRGRLLVSRDDERLATLIEETVPRYLDIEPIIRRALQEAFAP